MDDGGELLGTPRLKNGLAYYPGVRTAQGIVLVGNVVQLNLLTPSGTPYVGFGHLKGVWLWRDQPYIRVQYLAPAASNLPLEAVERGLRAAGAAEGASTYPHSGCGEAEAPASLSACSSRAATSLCTEPSLLPMARSCSSLSGGGRLAAAGAD